MSMTCPFLIGKSMEVDLHRQIWGQVSLRFFCCKAEKEVP
jgi:hypothetical protein